MPTAHLYIRVSTDRQEHSIGAQRERLWAKYTLELKDQGYAACEYADKAQSGGKRLALRRQGWLLLASLQPGDLVVITKLDRAFRSMRDMVLTCDDWLERGIHLCVLTPALDTSTCFGRLMRNIFGAFAEFERDIIAERTREGLEQVRRNGYHAGRAPYGWKLAGPKKKRILVPDPELRAFAAHIIERRQATQTSWERLAWELRQQGICHPHRKTVHPSTLRMLYLRELQLRRQEANGPANHRAAAEPS